MFPFWPGWNSGGLSDGNDRYNHFFFRNRQKFTDLIRITNAHNQSGEPAFHSLQDQILILKSQIITAPAVTELIISFFGFLSMEAGGIAYIGGYNISGMF